MNKFIFLVSLFFLVAILGLNNLAFATGSGAKLFKDYYCIDCHTLGHQGGTVGPNLSNIGKTKSLTWIESQISNPSSHFTRGSNTKINGKIYLVRMPGFNNIPDSVADKLAEYIKTFPSVLSNLSYKRPPEGMRLFEKDNCVACHRINGIGGKVGPNLSHIGKTKSLSWIETQVVDPKVHFRYGLGVIIDAHTYLVMMPSFKDIPDSQLNVIGRYLESLK